MTYLLFIVYLVCAVLLLAGATTYAVVSQVRVSAYSRSLNQARRSKVLDTLGFVLAYLSIVVAGYLFWAIGVMFYEAIVW